MIVLPGETAGGEYGTYNWDEALCYASGSSGAGNSGVPARLRGDGSEDGKARPFHRENIVRVIAAEEGENDGDSWIGVFELDDGTFGALRAGCDYTGWD